MLEGNTPRQRWKLCLVYAWFITEASSGFGRKRAEAVLEAPAAATVAQERFGRLNVAGVNKASEPPAASHLFATVQAAGDYTGVHARQEPYTGRRDQPRMAPEDERQEEYGQQEENPLYRLMIIELSATGQNRGDQDSNADVVLRRRDRGQRSDQGGALRSSQAASAVRLRRSLFADLLLPSSRMIIVHSHC